MPDEYVYVTEWFYFSLLKLYNCKQHYIKLHNDYKMEQWNSTQLNHHFIFSLVQLLASIWAELGPTQLKLVWNFICLSILEGNFFPFKCLIIFNIDKLLQIVAVIYFLFKLKFGTFVFFRFIQMETYFRNGNIVSNN